ncbi:GNAT family N-acetyltransferase [Nocardioides sp. NPDC006303]|uniref:GNAT family N-acetyltransferase n=1 Tax=Nocardioides sp. NPDC006303 TaxID=3156747 RepID=UPI002FAE44E4
MPRIIVAEISSDEQRALALDVWRAANAARRRTATEARIRRVREKLESAELALLAHYGTRPAGMLVAETYLVDGVPLPGYGHISMVFVDPAVWGSHVGTEMIRDLQSRGWEGLSVWTRTDNRRAQRLYERTGFTDTNNRSILHDGDEIMQLAWAREGIPG